MPKRSLLKRVVRKIRDGVHTLRDDARYPGRDHPVPPSTPPGGSPVSATPEPAPPSAPVHVEGEEPSKNLRSGEDVPWYLADGNDVDGWDEVDGGS